MPRTAAELLADLRDGGFTVSLRGADLAVSPAMRVSIALRGELIRHKTELVRLLAESDAPRKNGSPACQDRSGNAIEERAESSPVPAPIAAQRSNLREAWERLRVAKEEAAARDTLEADRRRERARFEQARAQWAAEDAANRPERIAVVDGLFGTDAAID